MKLAVAASAQKIQALLGTDFQVLEFDAGTRTAAEAAAAIGCSVAEIAKSLMFRIRGSDQGVLVVASGTNRVDEGAVSALVGARIERADSEFVRKLTGFAIGGVPPIGHVTPSLTLIDDDLFAFTAIWAAAGTPNAVFRLTPAELQRLTGGRRARVAKAMG